MAEPECLLSSNFDIIFIIVSLLPTDTLVRLKSVCRLWAQVISDPAFVRAHCSRPSLITAVFKPHGRNFGSQTQALAPFQEGHKFPTAISGILSNGFKVVSRNHSVLCFYQNGIFVVGNPVTSHWSVVQNQPEPRSSPFVPSYGQDHSAVLIYDPTISLSFKLAVPLVKFDHRELRYYIKFNIYSSDTCLWTESSVFTREVQLEQDEVPFERVVWKKVKYEPCKIGGGLICWRRKFDFLVGYEVSTDTFWTTPLPVSFHHAKSEHMSSYDGTIHFTRIGRKVAKVWRLETKDSWVLEGEGCTSEFRGIVPHWIVYDTARRALLIGDITKGKLYALHSSNSRLETLCQRFMFLEDVSDHLQVAHGNTLAPLDGVERGIDGLAREFRWTGLSPLNLQEMEG